MPEQPDRPRAPDQRGPALVVVLLLIVGLIVIAWGAGQDEADGLSAPGEEPDAVLDLDRSPPLGPPAPARQPEDRTEESPDAEPAPAAGTRRAVPRSLPDGGRRIFGGNHFLVAYYGTGQTASMGVLGESDADTMDARLRRAAAPFRGPDRPVRHVYELIVTIADRSPGPDGDYSHDIPREVVETYLRAARRNKALLLLDLQPGRGGFLAAARRWEWALRDPWVGLALDPEWRMGPHQVPGSTIGQVDAAEVNRTSAWLARLTRSAGLPEKLFVLHQFRVDMVHGIADIRRRPGLAMVQHVDGFGTRQQKRATYRAVARPRQFAMGFKLFYDEDVDRMGPRAVHALRPEVRFVSFQ